MTIVGWVRRCISLIASIRQPSHLRAIREVSNWCEPAERGLSMAQTAIRYRQFLQSVELETSSRRMDIE